MTMKEFKKYLDNLIEQKENELKELTDDNYNCRHSLSYQTHLRILIKEYKDIRKVINQ